MTTYVYETIPTDPNTEPKLYEIRQSMSDAPLETHPETGEPIKRVILGGIGVLSSGVKSQGSGESSCSEKTGCC